MSTRLENHGNADSAELQALYTEIEGLLEQSCTEPDPLLGLEAVLKNTLRQELPQCSNAESDPFLSFEAFVKSPPHEEGDQGVLPCGTEPEPLPSLDTLTESILHRDENIWFSSENCYGLDAPSEAPMEGAPNLPCSDFPLDLSSFEALQDALRTRDEGFSRMLLRLIDESGMTDPQCYKAAHITAQHFSKIRTNPEHKPDKITVIKFAIALKLSEEDAETLLRSAGFDFSPHNNSDIIMRFFFRKRIYDMYTIDQVLYHFDQPLLCGLK